MGPPDGRLDPPDGRPVGSVGDTGRVTDLAAYPALLQETVDAFDDERLTALLDEYADLRGVEGAIQDLVVPALATVGRRWAAGEIGVAQEHLASSAIQRWLNAHMHRHLGGAERSVLMACPPGERHDLPLLASAVVLVRLGHRVYYLGPNTPMDDLFAMARVVRPDAVVLASTRTTAFEAHATALRILARDRTLALAGAGATDDVVQLCSAFALRGDPVSGAHQLDGALRAG